MARLPDLTQRIVSFDVGMRGEPQHLAFLTL